MFRRYQFGVKLPAMQRSATYSVTPRTQIKRQPQRACYERAAVHAVLDEALIASVGFVDGGAPIVIPMAFARQGERILLHGASKSRMLLLLAEGVPTCVTVTLLDGLVLARSAMHHSMNYRSVMILGQPFEIVEEVEKRAALDCLVNHVLADRALATRPANALELRATRVFGLELTEVSLKTRSGGPLDDAEDLSLPYWAGVIPLSLEARAPLPDAAHCPSAPPPSGAFGYRRGSSAVADPEVQP